MKGHWSKLIILLLIVTAAITMIIMADDYLTVEQLNVHKKQLLSFIRAHHVQAVIFFVCLYVATAFFLPGALALTIAGGMLFGTVSTSIYANIGSTIGAVLAFLAARFIMGRWLQERYREPLKRFNWELSQHGHNYLLMLRILPLAPFFVVNYCAGLTRISLKTFVWTTSIGTLPGSLIYAFIGTRLRNVHSASDVISCRFVFPLLLLSLFALFPVVLHHLQGFRKQPPRPKVGQHSL